MTGTYGSGGGAASSLDARGFWARGYTFDFRHGDLVFAALVGPSESEPDAPYAAWGRRGGRWVRLSPGRNTGLTPDYDFDTFEALRDDVMAEADRIMQAPRLSEVRRANEFAANDLGFHIG